MPVEPSDMATTPAMRSQASLRSSESTQYGLAICGGMQESVSAQLFPPAARHCGALALQL
jgi:hypothetical protein